MLFLKLDIADMLFDKETFTWKTYTTNKALSTTKQVQIIDKKDFVIVVLDINSEMFVVYVAIWKREEILVYFKR